MFKFIIPFLFSLSSLGILLGGAYVVITYQSGISAKTELGYVVGAYKALKAKVEKYKVISDQLKDKERRRERLQEKEKLELEEEIKVLQEKANELQGKGGECYLDSKLVY